MAYNDEQVEIYRDWKIFRENDTGFYTVPGIDAFSIESLEKARNAIDRYEDQ